MTIAIPTTTKGSVTAYHREQDGQPGYGIQVYGTYFWLAEADADALARYFLFKAEPEEEVQETPSE